MSRQPRPRPSAHGRCRRLPAPVTHLRGCALWDGLAYDPLATCRRHRRLLAARRTATPAWPALRPPR